jgi:hypothetical protein
LSQISASGGKFRVPPEYSRLAAASRLVRYVSAPPARAAALVFEGGPSALQVAGSDDCVTEVTLGVLDEFGSRATFLTYGSTAENYPDIAGKPGSKYARGRKYDHLPAFALDDLSGAASLPETLRRISREGHEPANGGFRGITASRRPGFRERAAWKTDEEVMADLVRLADFVFEATYFDMRFARPPHDVAVLPGGRDIFPLYEQLRYHYLMPSADLRELAPDDAFRFVRGALERNSDALSGAVISLCDGVNERGDIMTAPLLRQLLGLFERYGYRVVSAGELLERSAFEDVASGDGCFEAALALDRAGFAVGFRDNRLYPDREVTRAELGLLFAGDDVLLAAVDTRGDEIARPKMIAAAAGNRFLKVASTPKSSRRSDLVVWLAEVAAENGLL